MPWLDSCILRQYHGTLLKNSETFSKKEVSTMCRSLDAQLIQFPSWQIFSFNQDTKGMTQYSIKNHYETITIFSFFWWAVKGKSLPFPANCGAHISQVTLSVMFLIEFYTPRCFWRATIASEDTVLLLVFSLSAFKFLLELSFGHCFKTWSSFWHTNL